VHSVIYIASIGDNLLQRNRTARAESLRQTDDSLSKATSRPDTNSAARAAVCDGADCRHCLCVCVHVQNAQRIIRQDLQRRLYGRTGGGMPPEFWHTFRLFPFIIRRDAADIMTEKT